MGIVNESDGMAFLKGVGYAAYTAGLSVPVGIARLIFSVAYLAKHAIYANAYEKAANAEEAKIVDSAAERQREVRGKKTARNRENRQAERENKGKTGGWWRTKATKAKNGAANLKDKAVEGLSKQADAADKAAVKTAAKVIRAKEETQAEMWKSEFWRGLVECIPVVGGFYYTLADYGKIKSDREWKHIGLDLGASLLGDVNLKPGFWGLNRLEQLMDFEGDLNSLVWAK